MTGTYVRTPPFARQAQVQLSLRKSAFQTEALAATFADPLPLAAFRAVRDRHNSIGSPCREIALQRNPSTLQDKKGQPD